MISLKNSLFIFLVVVFFSGCTKEIESLSKNMGSHIITVNKSNYKKPLKTVIKEKELLIDYEFQHEHTYKYDGITKNLYLKSINLVPNDKITDFAVVSNDEIIISSMDKMIYQYNIKDKIKKNRFLGMITSNSGSIENIALSPDKKYIAVSGDFFKSVENYDSSNDIERFANPKTVPIRIYDYKTGKLVVLLRGHKEKINDLEFTKNGKYLISSSKDKTIRKWVVTSFKRKDEKEVDSYKITRYGIEIDYLKLKTFDKGNNFDIFNLTESGSIIGLISDKDGFHTAYSISSFYNISDFDINKTHLAAISNKNIIEIYNHRDKYIDDSDNKSFRKVKILKTSQKLKNIFYSKNGNYLVSVSQTSLDIYDTKKDYKKINSISLNIYKSLGFLNKSELIYSNKENEIYSINIFSSNNKKLFTNNKKIINKIRIDNNKIYVKSKKENIVFDIKTKSIKKNKFPLSKKDNKITFYQKHLNELVFLEDGFILTKIIARENLEKVFNTYKAYKDFVVIGGENGTVLVYHKYGYLVASLAGHSGGIKDISINKDTMITLSNDNTILFWDLTILDNVGAYLSVLENGILKPRNIDYEWSVSKPKKNSDMYFALQGKSNIPLQLQLYESSRESWQNNGYYTEDYTAYDIIDYYLGLSFNKKNEYILWNQKGYFTYSGDANKGLGYHLNNKLSKESTLIEINKFYDTFYRPDLVSLSINKKSIKKFTKEISYEQALKNPPPHIKILNKNKVTKKDSVNLKFDISQTQKGGVGLIRIYQEGKLVKTIGEGSVNKKSANIVEQLETKQLEQKASIGQKKYLESMDQIASKSISGTVNIDDLVQAVKTDIISNKDGSYSINLPLKSGLNNIEIEAFNKTNSVTSLREKITIHAKVPKKEPIVYAIVAGVNEFENSKRFSNLKYSQNDAKAIKEAISKNIKEKVEVSYFVGKDLTKENIFKVVEEIKSKARLEDKVIFYISTHGKAIKGNLYLIPQNNKKAKNWIKFEEMFKKIQSINALEQIFIIDACESGKAKDIVASIYDSKASVLAKSSGVHVLLATTKGTFAFEHPDPNVKHGVFTNNILKALDDRSTDKNRDKKISVIELSKVLRSPKYVSEHQYPVIRNVGQDTKIRDIK